VLHVLVQGAKGIRLFADARDRQSLTHLIKGAGVRHFAIGKSSYHLILDPGVHSLRRILHDINRRYSRAYKKRHGMSRAVFAGRTSTFALPNDFWMSRTRRTMGSLETPMEVCKARISWLLAWATEHESKLGGESPKTIAVVWARHTGVPPRAIAEALGYASGHSVIVVLDSIRKRARRTKELRKLLANAP
jgi:hypothetical protein